MAMLSNQARRERTVNGSVRKDMHNRITLTRRREVQTLTCMHNFFLGSAAHPPKNRANCANRATFVPRLPKKSYRDKHSVLAKPIPCAYTPVVLVNVDV